MPHTSRPICRELVSAVVVALGTPACSPAEPSAPATGAGTTTSATSSATTATGSTSASSAPRTPTRPPAAQPVGPVTLMGGLDIAWSVAVLPDGSALVSERNTGLIHHVPKPGAGGRATVAGKLPITRTEGEGGLLGLAVPEDFDADPVFYAYYSTESDNRIAAVPWRDGTIGEPVVIFSGIPRGRNHNGGRIAFGPDGYFYVGMGEAGDTSLSQNLDSLGGKILRITSDGDPFLGNLFGGFLIWSYKHR